MHLDRLTINAIPFLEAWVKIEISCQFQVATLQGHGHMVTLKQSRSRAIRLLFMVGFKLCIAQMTVITRLRHVPLQFQVVTLEIKFAGRLWRNLFPVTVCCLSWDLNIVWQTCSYHITWQFQVANFKVEVTSKLQCHLQTNVYQFYNLVLRAGHFRSTMYLLFGEYPSVLLKLLFTLYMLAWSELPLWKLHSLTRLIFIIMTSWPFINTRA